MDVCHHGDSALLISQLLLHAEGVIDLRYSSSGSVCVGMVMLLAILGLCDGQRW